MLREPQIHLGLWVELENQKIVVFQLDQPNACGLGKRDQKLIKMLVELDAILYIINIMSII